MRSALARETRARRCQCISAWHMRRRVYAAPNNRAAVCSRAKPCQRAKATCRSARGLCATHRRTAERVVLHALAIARSRRSTSASVRHERK